MLGITFSLPKSAVFLGYRLKSMFDQVVSRASTERTSVRVAPLGYDQQNFP